MPTGATDALLTGSLATAALISNFRIPIALSALKRAEIFRPHWVVDRRQGRFLTHSACAEEAVLYFILFFGVMRMLVCKMCTGWKGRRCFLRLLMGLCQDTWDTEAKTSSSKKQEWQAKGVNCCCVQTFRGRGWDPLWEYWLGTGEMNALALRKPRQFVRHLDVIQFSSPFTHIILLIQTSFGTWVKASFCALHLRWFWGWSPAPKIWCKRLGVLKGFLPHLSES